MLFLNIEYTVFWIGQCASIMQSGWKAHSLATQATPAYTLRSRVEPPWGRCCIRGGSQLYDTFGRGIRNRACVTCWKQNR